MSFLGGALGGFADQYGKDKGGKKNGLIQRVKNRKKKSSGSSSGPAMGVMGDFRHGGRVKKTGVYRLHAGETVTPKLSRSRGKKR